MNQKKGTERSITMAIEEPTKKTTEKHTFVLKTKLTKACD